MMIAVPLGHAPGERGLLQLYGFAVTDPKTTVLDTIQRVQPISKVWMDRAEQKLAKLTKPPGSLGRLEEIAARLCAIQQTLEPVSMKRRVIVCVADHGVVAEGVSAYPSAVTAQMVANFANGGAAINSLARVARAGVCVVDVGVSGPLGVIGDKTKFVSRRVREGTANMTQGAAMSQDEMLQALVIGIEQADRAAGDGVALFGLGEMGIGNTTAASAITATLTGLAPAQVTGRGTGIDESQFTRKIEVVERALALVALRLRPFVVPAWARHAGGLRYWRMVSFPLRLRCLRSPHVRP